MPDDKQRFRLVTRSDFDGLACGVLLKELGLITEIKFVHPKDMQDGLIEIGDSDITTNLPYVEGVHLAFDHHLSEMVRNEPRENYIILPDAPSAARVVYDHYGGSEKFAELLSDMMEAVDKADSAAFSLEDVLEPGGWNLLNFIMDARTGLGRFRNFRISNYQLMMDLIEYCRVQAIEEILQVQDVRERTDLYVDHQELFRVQIRKCATVHKNVLVVDLRGEETIFAGNRFIKYALYPETNVSIQVIWGFKKQNTVLSVGRSIFDKSSMVNIGELMLEHGGGGHEAAGTCQIANDLADTVAAELVDRLAEE